jgi:hypothetical protein
MMEGMIRTMTVTELVNDLRSHGIKTDTPKCTAFIIKGLYPFAIGYREKRANMEIYTKLYEEWLKERIG